MLFAAVDQAVEERSGGDDYGLRAHGAAVAEFDTENASLVEAEAKGVVGRWSLVVGNVKIPTLSKERRRVGHPGFGGFSRRPTTDY